MTVEEKEKELFGKMYPPYAHEDDIAKMCAIICCDEIIKAIPMYTGNLNPDWKYWQEVKTYIQSL